MSAAKRPDTAAAVAGLFDRPSVTGGLARRGPDTALQPAAANPTPRDQRTQPASNGSQPGGPSTHAVEATPAPAEPSPTTSTAMSAPATLRLGVELTEDQVGYLRSLSRPGRTGGPRTLGSKFVAAGVLAAAIELLQSTQVDMHGLAAGDLADMTDRARDALLRAGRTAAERSEP